MNDHSIPERPYPFLCSIYNVLPFLCKPLVQLPMPTTINIPTIAISFVLASAGSNLKSEPISHYGMATSPLSRTSYWKSFAKPNLLLVVSNTYIPALPPGLNTVLHPITSNNVFRAAYFLVLHVSEGTSFKCLRKIQFSHGFVTFFTILFSDKNISFHGCFSVSALTIIPSAE